ncbi:MAG: cyclopropane-fatty-acyl-phospholipid synthase [Phycisphaerales bacterium]|jgi:cyclopropane-fatty-acyl-phospholipid synthase
MDGWWECEALDQMLVRCLRADLPARLRFTWPVLRRYAIERLFNLQKPRSARRNAGSHYNRGNDLFERMLDGRLVYSCGFWEGASTLDEAQENKLELICQKLGLEPGMRVLDIGCGWGGFAGYAAERYGCEVVGVTVSSEQAQYASARYVSLPVEIQLRDYREVDEPFDRVVSVGMFEHVGPKNYAAYMRVVRRCLKGDGLCLLHFFATQRPWPNLLDSEVLWVSRHIFPGFVVPTLGQVGGAVDGRFVTEDLHNFGADYDPTLMAWFDNFDRRWPELRDRYSERFYRMWKYYLMLSAAAFRSRKYQLWQLVLSRHGVPGGYRSRRGLGLFEACPFETHPAEAQAAKAPLVEARSVQNSGFSQAASAQHASV